MIGHLIRSSYRICGKIGKQYKQKINEYLKKISDEFPLFTLLTQWNNAFSSPRETSSMEKYKGSDSTELTIVRSGQEITTKSRYLKFKRPHILSRTK